MNFEELAKHRIANAKANIETLIKFSDLSYPTVSMIIGEGKRYFTRVLQNKENRKLSLSAVIKIAALFGISLNSLFFNPTKFWGCFKIDKNKIDLEKVGIIKARAKQALTEYKQNQQNK